MKETISSRIGHLTMLQTVDERVAEADDVADLLRHRAGEDDASAVIVSRMSRTTVMPRRTGIFFQIGRPSGTSQTLLDASMNAPM